MDIQQRLLGSLTREFNIAQPTHRECHGEASKPDNKHGKRCVITALCCADDLTEVGSGFDGGTPWAGMSRR
jgi:hypothetical protein